VLLKDLLKRKSGEEKLDCLYHLTNAYFMAGRYSDAASIVLEMTQIKPKDPELWNALGNNYFFDGRDSLAKEAFGKALEFSPNYGDCYFKLGQLSLKQKDFETSLFYFTKAESLSMNLLELIEANLSLGEAYHFLGKDSLKKERYKKAKEYSEMFLKNAPDNSLSYLKMGQSLLGLNQLSPAIDYLNGALFMEKRAKRLGEIYLALGRAYHKKGELAMAKSLYRRVLLEGSGKLEKEQAKEFLKALY
jgi:tetratricopeptide (TPR) repeat protein